MGIEHKKIEKKKLIVLTSTYPRWVNDNIPKFVAYLCKELNENYEVHVLAPHYKGAKTREVIDDIKIFRFIYTFPSWERLAYGGGIMENIKNNRLLYLIIPFFLLSQTLLLYRLNLRFNYSLIHAHWLIPQGTIAVLFRQFSKKNISVLVTSHGGDLFALNNSMLSRIKKWVLTNADHITVVSNVMKSMCEKLGAPPQKISVLPMGVNLAEKFTPGSRIHNVNSLIYVGRLVEKKGVSFLITAMSLLVKANTQLHLTIVGDGPMRSQLESQRDTLFLQNNITFLGSILNEALPKLFRNASIAIVPSVVAKSGDQEGLGLVIVEAMGTGCAVVASDLPAIHDLIKDGETGLLAKPGAPKDLSLKIETLINDNELRNKLAIKGREFVFSQYDRKNVGANYIKLINNLIP